MSADQQTLPRRDWLILPLVSVFTLGLLLGLSEVSARFFWPEDLLDRCAMHDPVMGLRFQPNCRSEVKSAESPWLENAYNACGFRTAGSCGPKPEGGFRVAVIGSSISSGYMVPYAETFFARAAALLQERCHVPVDFQNLAVPGIGLERMPFHLDAALTLKPNVVLIAMSPHDLQILGDDPVSVADVAGAVPHPQPPAGSALGELRERIRAWVVKMRASRAFEIAQHFMYQNLETYLPLYLQHGDEADYLRPPLNTAWRARLALFDREIGDIAARVQGKSASVMLVFVPSRAQALLLHWRHLPSGIDPTLLGRELAAIAHRHGVDYLDLTDRIGDRPDVGSLFYPVDSHPNSAGSAVIAQAVTLNLLSREDLPGACRGPLLN